jgi:hypothetical protein
MTEETTNLRVLWRKAQKLICTAQRLMEAVPVPARNNP